MMGRRWRGFNGLTRTSPGTGRSGVCWNRIGTDVVRIVTRVSQVDQSWMFGIAQHGHSEFRYAQLAVIPLQHPQVHIDDSI